MGPSAWDRNLILTKGVAYFYLDLTSMSLLYETVG